MGTSDDSKTGLRRISSLLEEKDPKTGTAQEPGHVQNPRGGREARARRAVLQAARVNRVRLTRQMILVAGPYRSGTGDDPRGWRRTSASWNATRCRSTAPDTCRSSASGSRCRSSRLPDPGRSATRPFNEIFHPIAERLLERCDAVLRVGGASQGADLMVRVAEARGLHVYRRLSDVPGCESLPEPRR